MKNRIVLFFGEMGSGKSYLANRYANMHAMHFIEGDLFLSPEMRARVSKFMPPTKKQLADLVGLLGRQVGRLALGPRGIVVSQALYRNEHRRQLIAFWEDAGYEVTCFWVKPSFLQNLKQLRARRRGIRWVLFWLASRAWFETPDHAHIVLTNER